jgi:hypothetical protein
MQTATEHLFFVQVGQGFLDPWSALVEVIFS